MKNLINILWLIFGGLFMSVFAFVCGAVCCATIVLIPVGLKFFKFGKFMIWPAGKTVVPEGPLVGFKRVINIVWAVLFGWEMYLAFILVGSFLFITVIGMAFAKIYFKSAKFVIFPLSHDFIEYSDVA